MYDDDSPYFEQVCRSFVKIADAEDANEVTTAFADGMSALQQLAKEGYARIQRGQRNQAISEVHDHAVRAAGGE